MNHGPRLDANTQQAANSNPALNPSATMRAPI